MHALAQKRKINITDLCLEEIFHTISRISVHALCEVASVSPLVIFTRLNLHYQLSLSHREVLGDMNSDSKTKVQVFLSGVKFIIKDVDQVRKHPPDSSPNCIDC